MTEIENQKIDPTQPTLPVVLDKGGDAGAQAEASENTDGEAFTGTRADQGDLESLDTVEVVEGVEALVATPDEVKAFVERLLRLYAISYSWKHVEDTVRNRLMGELPMGFDVATLISMAVDASQYNGTPDHDTRGQEPDAHGDDSELAAHNAQHKAEIDAEGEADDVTRSALSVKTGISDETLDEALPCGHTRRQHHDDMIEEGGPMGLLAKIMGEGPVKMMPLPDGFNLFEALGLPVRQPAEPTERKGSPLQQELSDDTPLIEAKLEITLPNGELWSTEIDAPAGHAWGHSFHGNGKALEALARLVEHLVQEFQLKLDREVLLSRLSFESEPENTCVK